MKTGELTSGSGRLHDSLDVLMGRWESTKEQWQDQVRIDFEQQYLEQLPARVITVVERLSGLSQLLIKIRHDCADSDD